MYFKNTIFKTIEIRLVKLMEKKKKKAFCQLAICEKLLFLR